MDYIQRGTRKFLLVNIALFVGGFNTFAILWGTQPLLPEISSEFNISPAASSLSLSVTTITLAVSMLIAGSLSEVFGRKSVMTFALVASSILSILTAFSPSFPLLILNRILQGITLAGLPAVAMAYLGEEIDPKSLGMAMGLYISGNSVGGMSGRIISGILTDHFGWRIAIEGIGIMALLASIVFWFILPKSTHFKPRTFAIKPLVTSLFSQFKVPGLVYIFMTGFLLMASFVSLYNYIGFQLIAPPYSLSQTVVGFIFIVYAVGTFSSTWMGMLADQYGKKKLLQVSLVVLLIGACITLSASLWVKIIGIAVFTFGFFAGHSIASSWVGQLAKSGKAQAASIYLFLYYFGSSIGGTVSGFFYSSHGWVGVITMIVVFSVISIILSLCIGVAASRKVSFILQKVHNKIG